MVNQSHLHWASDSAERWKSLELIISMSSMLKVKHGKRPSSLPWCLWLNDFWCKEVEFKWRNWQIQVTRNDTCWVSCICFLPLFFSLSISHVEGTILKRCWVRNLVLHSHVVFRFMDLAGVLGTPLNRASENGNPHHGIRTTFLVMRRAQMTWPVTITPYPQILWTYTKQWIWDWFRTFDSLFSRTNLTKGPTQIWRHKLDCHLKKHMTGFSLKPWGQVASGAFRPGRRRSCTRLGSLRWKMRGC